MKVYRKSELLSGNLRSKSRFFNSPYLSKEKAIDVLMEAREAWDSLDEFRSRVIRNREYTYGNQWGDRIRDPRTGKSITEEDYILSQGKVPLKNNLIRQLVKSVVGQFASNRTEPVCVASDRDEQKLGEMMSIIMKYVYSMNRLWDMDRRDFELFLITGMVCHKVTYGWNSAVDKEDTFVYNVDCRNFFFDNNMQDYRYWDCSLLGEVHDMSISDLIAAFSFGDRERARRIREIYRSATVEGIRSYYTNLDAKNRDNMGFFNSAEPGLCRVIEVWRKESRERYKCHDVARGKWFKIDIEELSKVEAINASRLADAMVAGIPEEDVALIEYEYFIDRFWVGRWLSPFGDLLQEMETPYWHKSHPYVFVLYPFIHGEVHSFVGDIIDQQKYINRLITMIDFIMGASAKGVLLFPEDQIPDGMTVEDIAEEWTRYNGVILFKPKPGIPMPQQVSANATNVGAYDLLNLQMKLLNEVSGVHSAMQGQTAASGKAASLYAQEAQNSAMNLVDVVSSFNTFREDRDTKAMQVTQQFYRDKRYINIAGADYSEEAKMIDPDKVRNVQFDLTIKESASTPAFRQLANEFLLQLFGAGQISVEELLENGDFPFADRLLQSISKRKEEMQQMQAMQGGAAPEDIQQSIEGRTNPLMGQMIKG